MVSPSIAWSAVAAVAIGLTGCATTTPPALVPTPPALVPTPPALVPTPPALVPTPPGLVPTPPTTVEPVEIVPRTVRIGQPAINGSLVFVVRGVRRAERLVDEFDEGWHAPPSSDFIIVSMSVRNISRSAVFFYPSDQLLVVDGTQVEPDDSSIWPRNGLGQIQPGLTIHVELPYLIRNGIQPEAIMVSDALYAIGSPGSPATRVELK
jgi:hypothetical protein